MGYQGRIIALVITFLATFIILWLHYIDFNRLEMYHSIHILYLFIAWKLGEHYDKAKSLSQQLKHSLEVKEEQDQKYQSLFMHNPDAIYEFDTLGNFVSGNPGLVDYIGYSIDEIISTSFSPLVHPDDLEKTWGHFQKALHGDPQNYEIRVLHKENKIIFAEITNFPIFNNGKIQGVYGIAKDITRRKLAEIELINTKATLENTLYNQQGMIFKYIKKNDNFIHVLCDGQLMKKLGLSSEQVVGKTVFDFLDPAEAKRKLECYTEAWEGKQTYYIGRDKIGETSYYASLQPVFKNGQVVEVIGSCIDITERQRLEDELTYRAYHDSLTGLYNRRKFEEVINDLMEKGKEEKHKITLLFLDMDRFKTINDTLGHGAGDLLLQKIAGRLESIVDENDLVFRMGGDEFAIIKHVVNYDDVKDLANRILPLLKEPIIIKDQELHASTSIGISMYPEHGDNRDALMRSADIALYLAKEEGRGTYKFFNSTHRNKEYNRLQLENQLLKALGSQELWLQYQPRVDQNNNIVSVEALLRWNHPKWGEIFPEEFIPIAEETGLIIPIGDWVLRKVCEQNKLWQEKGFKPIGVSVNISMRQLFDPHFTGRVERILKETMLDPRWLEFEITESIMMRDTDNTLNVLNQLREMGIQLSVDDFGTGYSSLNYLHLFPLNTIKIDRSFIQEISNDLNDGNIIASSIISIAKHLNLDVVAEGVENDYQVRYLQQQGCDQYQGYFYHRPTNSQDIEVLLQYNVPQGLDTRSQK